MEREEAVKVVADAAARRTMQRPPMTIAGAVAKAMWIARQPAEYIVEPADLKEVMGVLLAALEASPCYLKAVRDGIHSFTLLAYDRAGHAALDVWIEQALLHGASRAKVGDAERILAGWRRRNDLRWPT